MIFASLSRAFAMNSKLNSSNFESFKTTFGKKLVHAELDMADVMALVLPLAAEEIQDINLWNHLANIVLSYEHKIP
jgi:hypothetical protein